MITFEKLVMEVGSLILGKELSKDTIKEELIVHIYFQSILVNILYMKLKELSKESGIEYQDLLNKEGVDHINQNLKDIRNFIQKNFKDEEKRNYFMNMVNKFTGYSE